ncbi:MAG: hypothetical protein AAF500_04410 [Myxococcota bacterium]
MALAFVWVLLGLNMNAPWGVMLLLWVALTVPKGSIRFVRDVDRQRSPLLFWCIEATWIVCGLYFIWLDLA